MYPYQDATILAFEKITTGTISHQSHNLGLTEHEPLIIAMDACLRYAKAYHKAYDSPLSEDYVLGPAWLRASEGIRALLDGNGAIAMERNISTDSKDNGAVESVFWAAMDVAGFEESDL